MVAVDIGTATNSNVLKRPAPLSIDQDMVDLVDSGAIRRLPCELVDVSVWKDGTTDYTVILQAETNQTFSVVVHHTATVFPHSSIAVGIISSDLGIHITHDQ